MLINDDTKMRNQCENRVGKMRGNQSSEFALENLEKPHLTECSAREIPQNNSYGCLKNKKNRRKREESHRMTEKHGKTGEGGQSNCVRPVPFN